MAHPHGTSQKITAHTEACGRPHGWQKKKSQETINHYDSSTLQSPSAE